MRKPLSIILAAVLLGCSATPSAAQEGPDGFGLPDLFATLARGDITSIPQDRNNYFAVSVTLTALGYAECLLHEPRRSLFKRYLVEFTARISEKSGWVTEFHILVHPRYREIALLLDARGCDSDEIQSIIWNGFRFGLGREPVEPPSVYLLSERESSQHRLTSAYVDRYCFRDPSLGGGLDTPACEELVNFVYRGRPRARRDGTVVPAVGEAVQLLTCVYGATANPNSGGEFPRRTYTFWYERVPDGLSSYALSGREDPFLRVQLVGVTECPADSEAVVDLLSGGVTVDTAADSPIGVQGAVGAAGEEHQLENQLCYGGSWNETASDFTWTITEAGDSLRLTRDDQAAEGMFGWDATRGRFAGTLRWWNGGLYPGMTIDPGEAGCGFQQLTITSPGLTAAMARSPAGVAAVASPANMSERSAPSMTQVQVTFVNSTSVQVDLFWVDFEGQEQPWGMIPAGGSTVQGSYANHVWRFKQGGRVLGDYTAASAPVQNWTIRTIGGAELRR